MLALALEPGRVVVMGKPGACRPKKTREIIEARGCELLYLLSYPPALSPIEEALSRVEHILRQIRARTRESLIVAIGGALGAVSSEDARTFFTNCGYRTPAQQL